MNHVGQLGKLCIVPLASSLVLLIAQFSIAQDAGLKNDSVGSLPVLAYEPSREVVLLPNQPGIWGGQQATPSTFSLETRETASRRFHTVQFNGRTHTASVPLEGSRSYVAFDRNQSKFVGILPSIRVELNGSTSVSQMAEAAGATNLTVFKQLGFAILDLPIDVSPHEAIVRVGELPGKPQGYLRTRSFNVKWR